MRWDNSETPTFAGNAGSGVKPAFVETMTLYDRDGSAVLVLTKNVDGTFTTNLTTSTVAEIDRFNDVSAYQESVIAAGALTLTMKYHDLSLVGAGAVTLAAPPATMLGQVKVIEMVTDNGDVTLSMANMIGGSASTTVTFNDAGDQLVLIAAASKWIVLKERGVTVA